jgi:GTP cyclohydrolase II
VSIAANYLAEAASDALRRGRAVGVGSLAILSAELADADTLAALETRSRAGLIITARRAAVLNLANQIAAAAPDPEPVWVDRPDWLDLTGSRAVADPVLDLATPFKGPFRTRALDGDAASARAAIALVKHAGLIPAVYAVPLAGAEIAVNCPSEAVLALPASVARVHISSRARLPLANAEDTQVVAFRPDDGGPEHLALVIGNPDVSQPVLARLHSSCLTGDVLGSLKCDCGPQLHAALAAIAAAASCSICNRKAAASACSTSCAPMPCRIRAGTRSTPTPASALSPTNAISPWPPRCSRHWASPTSP